MAEKKVIIIDVQTEDGVKAMNLLDTSFEQVYGEVQPLNTKLGELEDQLYQLANAGKANSDEFKVISKEVGRMKKVVAEVDLQVDALAMTTANKLGGALTGVASGFELAQGAMGAMGADSEEIEAALLKVQSAMAMAQGIQGLKESLPAFKAMGNAAKAAFGGIKGAIMATGIGLIIVGVGLLAANWDKVVAIASKFTKGAKEMVGIFSEKFPKAFKAIQTYLKYAFLPIYLAIEATKKLYDVFTGTTAATRKVAVEQKKVHDARIKQLDEEREAQKKVMGDLSQKIALLEAEGKSTIKLREEKLKLQKVDAESTLSALKATQAMAGASSSMGRAMSGMVADAKNNLNEIEVAEVSLTQEMKAEEQQRTDDAKAANEKRKADKQKAIDDELARLQKQRDDEAARDVTATLDRDKKFVDELDVLWNQEQEKAKIQKEARDKRIIDDKAAADIVTKNEADAQSARIQLASDAIGVIGELANALAGDNEKSQKRAFKINKAAAIAQAVISTYQAAQSAYASQMTIPTPDAPIRAAIAAGVAVASGFAKVAMIAKTKFEGGGASGGGGGGGGGGGAASISSPAQFNIVGNSGNNQLLDGLSNQPVKAFVVSGEVTTAQGLDRNRIQTASL